MQVWDSVLRYHFSKLPALSSVPRVVAPPEDVFTQYFVAQGAPVIFVDSQLFSGEPLTLDDIVRRDDGKIRVTVRQGDYLNVNARKQQEMALSEYVEMYVRPAEGTRSEAGASNALPPYAGNSRLTQEAFEALGLRYPACFEGKAFDSPRLWFGPAGSMTPLHYDSRDNLICQYIGSKHLTLYPPSQIPWLYTSGFAPSWSAVADPRDPDIKKFPLFSRARSLEVTLTAGELLYLPARWSHFVRNLETSLMVNFWPQYTTAQEMKIGLGQRVARAKRLVRRALP